MAGLGGGEGEGQNSPVSLVGLSCGFEDKASILYHTINTLIAMTNCMHAWHKICRIQYNIMSDINPHF